MKEARVQTVWWGLCIFSLTYILTNTSKSVWINLPMAILIFLGLRWFNQIEFTRNLMSAPRQSWEKNIDSLNDTIPHPPSWKENINSSVVEAAINEFIDKILNDFVINLWYSSITKDKEAPELIRGVIMDALGEISVRLKNINIVKLLTRDIVNLIGDHFESFRRHHDVLFFLAADDLYSSNQSTPLSSKEGDERLKCNLMSSGELYPALISPESEYKVLQKIVDGIFSVVLGPREANCPLVRTIVREIVTCLIVQPLLNLATPERINEELVKIINGIKERNSEQFSGKEQSANPASLSAFDNIWPYSLSCIDHLIYSYSQWTPPNAIVPIVNLVYKVFRLNRACWYRRPIFWILKRMLPICMDKAVDDILLKEESRLRNEDTVAHGIRWAQDLLWPNGVFLTRVGDGQEASDETGQLGGMKVAKLSSFKQKFEAADRASKIWKFLYDGAPTELLWLVEPKQYRRCARDIFLFTQSNVCIKQLTFAILELLVRTVFPELQDLLRGIRENSHGRSE